MTDSFWKKCSNCKKPIAFQRTYWVCNVSTCNRVRTGLQFCSVECWDAHVPLLRHRESWAEERRSPSQEEWAKILRGEKPESRTASTPATAAPSPTIAPPRPTPAPPRAILRKKI